MDKVKEKLSVSLSVEDFLRRFFLVELREQNLDELIGLSLNFSDKFKNHNFILWLNKCKDDLNLLDELRYEFNRLFVGPRHPKAEPYESVYFDYKTMFGEKTMQVRGFYESSGLKLSKEQFDKFPDDFIGYELQYLYFLSFNALQADEKEKMDEILHKKYDFIRTHPFEWFYKFSSRCKEATNLEAYVSFADFLNLYLENEIEQSRALLTFKS